MLFRSLSGWLWSEDAARALPRIAERAGTSAQMAVQAALGAVLAARAGLDHCVLLGVANNRYTKELREYVGTQMHESLISMDVQAARFDELVRRAGTATLKAGLNSLIDGAETKKIIQRVGRRRGVAFTRDCMFNDLSTGPQTPVRPTGETALRWLRWAENPGLLQVNLLQAEPELILGASTADCARVPRAELELLLRGVERLLVAAADEDLDLMRLAEVTGVRAPERDEQWLRIDSCWTDLREVQRLVGDALGTAWVFPSADGLVAWLAAGPAARTPGQAHDACLALLPGRSTAMAPSRYVVCNGTPERIADQTAWAALPRVAEGDGRS